jgi:hypothetical protein
VLTAEVAPYEAFGEGIATHAISANMQASYVMPIPQSLVETMRPDFVLQHYSGDAEDVITPKAGNPFFPSAPLKKIAWPADRSRVPGVTHYSIDGKPPF